MCVSVMFGDLYIMLVYILQKLRKTSIYIYKNRKISNFTNFSYKLSYKISLHIYRFTDTHI